VRRRAVAHIVAGVIAVDLTGVVLVVTMLVYVLPLPPAWDDPALRTETIALTALNSLVSGIIAVMLGLRIVAPIISWLERGPGEAPDRDVKVRILAVPGRFARQNACLWAGGSLVAAWFVGSRDVAVGTVVGLSFALAGASVSALTYLLTERAMRPLAGRALSSGIPTRPSEHALARRLMVTWVLGTGSGVAAIFVAGIIAITRPADTTLQEVGVTIVVLGPLVFALGGLSIYLVAKATADPVESLQRALADVEQGRLETRVRIWDGTELGVLQAGFNAMAEGLQERERIRDLFGKHVGQDVAEAALSSGVRFAGELREVSVLFVDLAGSTELAESTTPGEVVSILNRFFEVVIDVVHGHQGWINKFQGDAVMAIWGAPIDVDNRSTLALSAARDLGRRLREELPEVAAGVGVSDGQTVTGNVGTASRYEYTAVGDPVNEAARLTDLAKSIPGRVVANATMLEDATADERDLWQELPSVQVRGRSRPTRIIAPR